MWVMEYDLKYKIRVGSSYFKKAIQSNIIYGVFCSTAHYNYFLFKSSGVIPLAWRIMDLFGNLFEKRI